MTQDTGIIVAWHKQPGDAVSADDILAEVETDKTTVEIEVGIDGVVASVNAETGIPVPVGEIIAVIAEANEEAATVSRISPSPNPPRDTAAVPPAAVPSPEPVSLVPDTSVSVPSTPAARPSISPEGRILASPKTRRLARERGIDLGKLVAQGLAQPFHAADLDKARPDDVAPVDELCARVDSSAFDALHRWIESQSGAGLDSSRIWAAFAAASFRASTGAAWSSPLNIRVTSFGLAGEDVLLRDPDQTGLLTPVNAIEDMDAHLSIIDLGGTLFSSYRSAERVTVPTLTITRAGGGGFELKLQYSGDRFPVNTAIDLLTDLAGRAEEPLRQLL